MIYYPVKPFSVNRQMMTKRVFTKLSCDDFVTALEDVCGLKPGTLKGRRCYPRQTQDKDVGKNERYSWQRNSWI